MMLVDYGPVDFSRHETKTASYVEQVEVSREGFPHGVPARMFR